MVTIEQKLSVFSKLLERSMNDHFTAQMEKLTQDCQKKLLESKQAADLETARIEKKAREEAEKKRMEILNRSAMAHRIILMETKEELFSIMLTHLMQRVDEYIQSEGYREYLISLARQLDGSEVPAGNAVVCMMQSDLDRYGEDVRNAMPHIQKGIRSFEPAQSNILGGLILIDSDSDTRVDLSVRTLLEENKPVMMELLFNALSSADNNNKVNQ